MLARFVLLIPLVLLPACGSMGPVHPSADWDRLVADYLEAYFASRPDVAVSAGRHEHDGRFPDFSEAGLSRQIAMLEDWRRRAQEFAGPLDEQRRFERDYLLARIDGELWWLDRADGPHRNPAFYASMLDPDTYLTRPYAPLPQRMAAYTAFARNLVTAAAQIRANLRTPLPRTFIDRAHGMFGGLASFLVSDVPKVYASVTDRRLQDEFGRANAAAVAALRELDAWIESLRPTQTEAFALGPELFREMLYAIERVDTPLSELERIGRADLDRNLAALREACARFAPGATLPDCALEVNADKPKPGTVAAARSQLEELRQWLRDHPLVSIPSDEEALVAESPPYMRWNFAYIMVPGPYDKNMPSTYYVAPPDPAWSPEEQAAYIPGQADLLFTSVHEVWPGHFLQYLHANRSRSTFGRVFIGYAFAEGWAHYSEEMMWEAGLGDGDPEIHVGQLLNALLRNVRFLSAIGLHTQGMTVAQSEELFRTAALQDAGTARQQAARGTYDPEYLAYSMGKLMIRKLRDDWTASRGGRAAWRPFHDAFLSYGGPPIPLVRRAMIPGGERGLF